MLSAGKGSLQFRRAICRRSQVVKSKAYGKLQGYSSLSVHDPK
jgi:hypothetical protein